MERLRYILLSCFLLGGITLSWAQQPAQYSLYMLNKYAYNNAYNGLDESLSMTGVFRKQWVGFKGSPLSVNFNAHLPIEYLSSGIGLGFEYDAIGAYKDLSIRGSYSYIIDLGKAGKLSLGAAGRFLQKNLDGSLLLTPDGNYEQGVNHNDPNVPNIKESGISFSLDAAIYYKHKFFELGLSAINLTQPTLKLATDASVTYRRAYFFTATGNIKLSDKFDLHPSFLLKADFVKFQPEIAVILKWNNNIFGGLAFRGYDSHTADALIFVVGMQITKNIMLAYSYDLSVGSLQSYNSGSHEVVLNYNLNKKIGKEIPSKIIYNPRFL
ncbi:PorP/SprF family type IX secretion system membrane protein [Aureispira anguillae]|uniref:PorP/SprF family type IX secretion system membrane protein n=1 Tax=Aureispira anguillae TaxID=2864201 RepID=A0A915YIN2_9BACT|nr:PorP/SprF family type IX secretion system membrane protein [Aureispira anguillae]BDS13907.1 PorP/SprF family type IX secretion system membrane protein [Aureispira anguillae]